MPQHSNTLVFATNTMVALDVSASPTTGSPNITMGYKRQEGAWVPLVANGAGPAGERQPAGCTVPADGCILRGTTANSGEGDALSVLATFGADGSAGASGATGSPTASASGGIKQYFATGLAARILAQRGGAQLVSTAADSPDAGALAGQMKVLYEGNLAKIDKYLGTDESQFVTKRDALLASASSSFTGATAATAAYMKTIPTHAQFMGFVKTQPGVAQSLAAFAG
jgi:hypothetical protein